MTLDWNKTLPVVVSIAIIISIAILRNYSRTFASIVAVMPINIPLGMWIVYSGESDKQAALADFSQSLLLNIVPTFVFMVVAWQMTRADWGLAPTILAGYAVWAVSMLIVFYVRGLFGG
ncbi:MAG: hypothetical protein RLP44_06690 [Aggregatilineales bacterium]